MSLLLTVLFGYLGYYRFTKKQYAMGILYLFTFGLFGFGWIYDIYLAYRDTQSPENNSKVIESAEGKEKIRYPEEHAIAMKSGAKYYLEGNRGRIATVYEDRVVLTTKHSVGSLLTGNFSDGEKTIYFSDCLGVQFKKCDIQIGYIQFETASSSMNNKSDNFFNENSFTWDQFQQTNEHMLEVCNFVKQKIHDIKSNKNTGTPHIISNVSNADELKKYKELLEQGIISQEEFDSKKSQLLGL